MHNTCFLVVTGLRLVGEGVGVAFLNATSQTRKKTTGANQTGNLVAPERYSQLASPSRAWAVAATGSHTHGGLGTILRTAKYRRGGTGTGRRGVQVCGGQQTAGETFLPPGPLFFRPKNLTHHPLAFFLVQPHIFVAAPARSCRARRPAPPSHKERHSLHVQVHE
jgi:hypothetical protein